jgi:uncharacterized protein
MMNEPTEKNPGRMSALHLAAVDGDIDQVKNLLGQDPDAANALNINNQSPLFSILNRGGLEPPEQIKAREEAFNLLWDATDPKIRKSQDKQGNTVLQHMAVYGFDELAGEVLKKAPGLASRAMKTSGEYPIHTAILNGRLKVAEVLFNADAETPNRETFKLCTPLHYAARYGSQAMVELCCEHQKNNLDAHDREGKTPLAWAIEANRTDIKDYLIEQGADEALVDLSSETKSKRF